MRHRALLYKRGEEKTREAIGRADYSTLKCGDIVRLSWENPRVKYFFAEVTSIDRTEASAYLLETVNTLQLELKGPYYSVYHMEPANTSRTSRKVKLSNRGIVRLGSVSPAMIVDYSPGEKPVRNLACFWSPWDYVPIVRTVFNDN
jgi:hypothetical protein